MKILLANLWRIFENCTNVSNPSVRYVHKTRSKQDKRNANLNKASKLPIPALIYLSIYGNTVHCRTLFTGPWFGDPHIITSDGLGYTFNGAGEYLFTNITETDGNVTTIQARTERVVLDDGSKWPPTHTAHTLQQNCEEITIGKTGNGL